MIKYNIHKECRLCRARFIVPNGQSKRIYCDKCEKKANK